MIMKNEKLKLPKGFCDECCYDNNPHEELNCKKVKCCYLVRNNCLIDFYTYETE